MTIIDKYLCYSNLTINSLIYFEENKNYTMGVGVHIFI